MSRTTLAAALLTVLLAPLLASTPAEAAPSTSKAATTYAAKAHRATNTERTAAGLRTLAADRCLTRMAVAQAELMAALGELSHQDLGPVLRRCGLRGAGENVAMGFPGGPAVVQGWMASEGHRANILTPTFRAEGIGAARDADGRWWVAQVFGRRG